MVWYGNPNHRHRHHHHHHVLCSLNPMAGPVLKALQIFVHLLFRMTLGTSTIINPILHVRKMRHQSLKEGLQEYKRWNHQIPRAIKVIPNYGILRKHTHTVTSLGQLPSQRALPPRPPPLLTPTANPGGFPKPSGSIICWNNPQNSWRFLYSHLTIYYRRKMRTRINHKSAQGRAHEK